MIYALLALVWIISAVFIYGATLAYLQRGFPAIAEAHYRQDINKALIFAVLAGMLGPLGVLPVFLFADFLKRGLMYRA